LLGGKPLASYAVDAVRACREITEIVLVVAPGDVERARRVFLPGEPRGGAKTERIVAGGDTRQHSVRAGLAEVNPDCDLVLVHDAARPFLTSDLVRCCLEAARQHGAVVAALPAADTVKEVEADGAVIASLDRTRLWLVQTPQVFRYRLLVEAHEVAARDGFVGTDDASLVERLGHQVHVVLGDFHNIKITWQDDIRQAERYLSRCERSMDSGAGLRSGIGCDAHRFETGRPLVLAGVRFPGETGLAGYSDADVVCHAICDALLGAAGVGDLGQHFPDGDPRYHGISSLSLVSRTAEMVRAAGWEIMNIDSVVIAESPRIADKVPDMRRALAGALGIGAERISVKGKTTEGMGFTGRREGIASQAVALLREKG